MIMGKAVYGIPVDDLRHCPAWLRVSDKVAKEPAFAGRSKKKSPSEERSKPKTLNVFLFGEKLNDDPITMNQIMKTYDISKSTIEYRLRVGGASRDGYSFEIVFEGTYSKGNKKPAYEATA